MHLTRAELMRFFRKVHHVRLTGCWVWLGAERTGYGVVSRTGKLVPAHRLTYEMFVGPVPDGWHADHLCFNKACVNPAHVEPVTHAENQRRWAVTITHCIRGHAKTAATTGYQPNTWRRGKPTPFCLLCRRERDRERYRLYGERSGPARRQERAERANSRIAVAACSIHAPHGSPIGNIGANHPQAHGQPELAVPRDGPRG